ncbi:hypothetical protein HDU96_007402 [Phlyctochytrium bullatum]|nr:hypothetical protein HDU96_007402 [Phlyctochytrium bullatum]
MEQSKFENDGSLVFKVFVRQDRTPLCDKPVSATLMTDIELPEQRVSAAWIVIKTLKDLQYKIFERDEFSLDDPDYRKITELLKKNEQELRVLKNSCLERRAPPSDAVSREIADRMAFIKRAGLILSKYYSTGRLNEPQTEEVEAVSAAESAALDEALHYRDIEIPEDVVKLLEHEFLKLFKPDLARSAKFAKNCLESQLDQRQTFYDFEDESLFSRSESQDKKSIKILVSVSGSGKTRQLLELLYRRHGYYLVCKDLNDFGSGDLNDCYLLSDRSPDLVEYYINLLYFVRVVVCDLLKNFGSKSEFSDPHKILLAQLHPTDFFGCDIFKVLFRYVVDIGKVIVGLDQIIKKRCFDFAAIDEIQSTLRGTPQYVLTSSRRPFFSPLIYYSVLRDFFSHFILSGTRIKFPLIRELLESSAMKQAKVEYEVIQGLEPLNEDRAKRYIRQVLEHYGEVQASIVEEAVEKIAENPLFLGRGRFIAFLLDWIVADLENETVVEDAMRNFVQILSVPSKLQYPLRFYIEDKQSGQDPFDTKVGILNLGTVIRDGLIQCLYSGKATLKLAGQDATETVRYGIGFCRVTSGIVSSVELQEHAIVACLRHLFPIRDLVIGICMQLASFPKPGMVGYILEFLVAAALVANLNKECLETLMPYLGTLESYLSQEREDLILFPDNCCGPDIIYKCKGTVHIVQVKFVKALSRQERLNAAHTTDHSLFYTKRQDGSVLKGYEKRREEVLKQLSGFKVERYLFIHTEDYGRKIGKIDGVKVLTETLEPNFFVNLYEVGDSNLWHELNKVRERFQE